MKAILIIFALVLLAVWSIKFFFYAAGAAIHFVLIVAVIMFVLSFIPGPKNKS